LTKLQTKKLASFYGPQCSFYLLDILLSLHCIHVAFVNCLLKKLDDDDDDGYAHACDRFNDWPTDLL